LELLEGLPFQFSRLKSELSRAVDFTFKIPVLSSPPYPFAIFERSLSFLQKVEQQLSECTEKINLYKSKLSTLETDLNALFHEYIKLKADNLRRIAGYEKLAQILSLQIEYALLQTKKSKTQKSVEYLIQLKAKGFNQIETVFQNLKITKDDLIRAKQDNEKAIAQAKVDMPKLNEEYKQASKRVMIYEVKLDNLITKLKSQKSDQLIANLLQIEKERLKVIIETYQIKQKYIDQRKLSLKLKTTDTTFTYNWIKSYPGFPEAKKLTDLIKEWTKVLDELGENYNTLIQELADARVTKSVLIQKVATISKEIETASDIKFKKALSRLYTQLQKTNDLTDSLILKITENKSYLNELKNKVRCILDLMQKRVGWFERFFTWSKVHLLQIHENAKSILFYPLFTVGEVSVTLSSILKVLFLIFAGIVFLKIIRRKLTTILSQKTQLSFGAVNSITTLGYYFSLVLVTLIALSTAGVNLNQLSIVLGALGVGIGFGLQTIANNFISGLILLTDRSIKVGDFVELEGGITGEVKNVAIRATVIRTYDGEDIIVPNSEFVSGRVRTWTYDDDWRRLRIPFGVSYNAEPEEVVKIALEAAREVPTTVEDEDHPIRIRFEGFGESSLDFSIRVWCRMTRLRAYSGLISDYYFVLFKKLKDAGIEIPFPQRDIHFRSVSPEILKIQNKSKS